LVDICDHLDPKRLGLEPERLRVAMRGRTEKPTVLSAIIGKVTGALVQPYQELLDRLPNEDQLNVDETGHKQNRLRMWTWCFRAELYTLFKIDPTRSTDVLIEVLGTEFEGVLGCDNFSS
jgi:transposase